MANGYENMHMHAYFLEFKFPSLPVSHYTFLVGRHEKEKQNENENEYFGLRFHR